MIHFVKGILDTVSENMVVVENGGIGFEIMVPLSVVSGLPQIGNEVKIYTYTYVRENALQLYGFLTRDELSMFKLLITVSGIGPKGALGILSVMDADALRFAILADDAKSISKAPGIGAKTCLLYTSCREPQIYKRKCTTQQGNPSFGRVCHRYEYHCLPHGTSFWH